MIKRSVFFVNMLLFCCSLHFSWAENADQIKEQIGLLRTADGHAVQQIANKIVGIGKTAVPFLVEAMEEEMMDAGQDEYKRREKIDRIIICLTEIGDKSAVPYLWKLLEDKNGNVNIDAVQSLCALGEMNHLMKFAMEERRKLYSLRAESRESMSEEEIGEIERSTLFVMSIHDGIANSRKGVFPSLIDNFSDKDWEIRFFSAKVLETFCGRPQYEAAVIESFIENADDENLEVRKLIIDNLNFMTNVESKTGKRLERKEQWRRWWEDNKSQFGQ